MRHLARGLVLCLVAAWAAGVSASVRDEAIKVLSDAATQIALDPADFFFDLHLNTEDRTPLPIDKDWQVGTNILPGTLPFAELNLSGKGKLHREHGGWPQIEVGAGGWYSVAGGIVSSQVDDFSGNLFGYHGGISFSLSADPRLRIFGGYEFSQMRVNVSVDFEDEVTNSGTGFDIQNSFSHLNTGKTEHFLFAGAEVLRSARKRLVTEIGYGVVGNKLVARLTWSSKNFDSGFAFYPEGAWVVWPFWTFQVRF